MTTLIHDTPTQEFRRRIPHRAIWEQLRTRIFGRNGSS